MKTSIPTLRNFIGGVLFGFLIVALMFVTMGCSKDKKGGAAVAPRPPGYGGYYPNYPGHPGYGGGAGMGQYFGNDGTGSFQIALQLTSEGYNYQGMAWAYGELFVTRHVPCNGIYNYGPGLVPGQWQVRSLQNQPAQLNQDLLQGLRLEAQGPSGYAIIAIDWAKLISLGGQGRICSGVSGFDELVGYVRIESINGMYCGFTTAVDAMTTPPVCGY